MTSTLEAVLFVAVAFGAAGLFFIETFLAIYIGKWAAGPGFARRTVLWFSATMLPIIFGAYMVLLMADDTGIPENCKILLLPAAFYPLWFFAIILSASAKKGTFKRRSTRGF